jgi:hypothetical protein
VFSARYELGLEIKGIDFCPLRVDVQYSKNATCSFVGRTDGQALFLALTFLNKIASVNDLDDSALSDVLWCCRVSHPFGLSFGATWSYCWRAKSLSRAEKGVNVIGYFVTCRKRFCPLDHFAEGNSYLVENCNLSWVVSSACFYLSNRICSA